MNQEYRASLVQEKQWRLSQKEKLLNKLCSQKTFKGFSQIVSVIERHNEALDKVNKILKDGKAW